MISIDTNILFHGWAIRSPFHKQAIGWLSDIGQSKHVTISELVLAEFYGLIRNPAVTTGKPLTGPEAMKVIRCYREHPRWQLVGYPDDSRQSHDRLWKLAGKKDFAFRRLYDVRTALTLLDHGVTRFATCNLKDFQGLGFDEVWNPLATL